MAGNGRWLTARRPELPWQSTALSDVYEGYQSGKKSKRDEEKELLANALAQEQGQHARDINKFYPEAQMQENKLKTAQIGQAETELEEYKKKAPYALDEAIAKSKKATYEADYYHQDKQQERLAAELKAQSERALIDQRTSKADLTRKQMGHLSTPRQEAFYKEQAKQDAAIYGDANVRLAVANNTDGLLKGMDQILLNPLVKNAIGPLDKTLTALSGFSETRDMAAQLDIYRKQLVRDSLSLFKGQSSDYELKYAESNYPENSNTYSTYMGKLKALNAINNQMRQRSKLTAQYISEGYEGWAALDKAQKETPIVQGVGLEQRTSRSGQNAAPGQYSKMEYVSG